MHVPPAWRRWGTRAVLAVVVALAVAYLPWRISGGDRITRLQGQLDQIRDEAAALEADLVRLDREIRALRTDPAVIEEHARDELGMVYPDELVLRVEVTP
jgi:cell division protein FtsB